MTVPVMIHVAAGGVGILSGAVALYAKKGATLHRRSGRLFVYAMLTMALMGAGIAAVKGQRANVIAGLLTTYLVVTALITVLPSTPQRRRMEIVAMCSAFVLGVATLALGIAA